MTPPDPGSWDRRLLHAAARITAPTDRPHVDAELLHAVAGLWATRHARLYEIGEPGAGTCRPVAELDEGRFTRYDMVSPSPELPLSEIAGACRAVARLEPLRRHAGASLLFPLCNRKGQPTRLLEVVFRQQSSPGDADLLRALLVIYDNHVRIIEDSERDALTALRNRRTFEQLLIGLVRDRTAGNTDAAGAAGAANPTGSRRVSRRERSDKWLAVLDLDRFKGINDTYGHLFGDEVLILVANLMRQSFRVQDSLFRFGGEEFVVVLQDTDRTGATTAFERFRGRLADHQFPQVGQVTVSVGYTEIAPGQLPSEILNRADAALYVAKQRGRNRCCCYEALVDEGELAPSRRSAGGGFELF